MSFVDSSDVMQSSETLLKKLWKIFKNKDISHVPVMTYMEAMNTYGNDHPDLRIPWKLKDLNEVVQGHGFKVFDDVLARKGAVKGFAVPGIGHFSRGQFDKLTKLVKEMGAKGLVWIKSDEQGQLVSPVSKFFSEEKLKTIFEFCGGKVGGAALIVADDWSVTCGALAHLRIHLARELDSINTEEDSFVWIVDFPMLDYSTEEGRWVAVHHPFTAPKDEFVEALHEGESSVFRDIKAKAYDLVCNGYEIAGGSVRIHDHEVQKSVFKAFGLSEEEVVSKFGFFIEALNYGTPPHGGIAWGFDRLLMILCGTDAIRDVIAFPKTAKAMDLMSGAPSPVLPEQLIELGASLGVAEA